MNRYQRYQRSEKGKLRDKRYASTEKGHQAVLRKRYNEYKRNLQSRIVTKQLKIAEFERMLENVQEI